jgi:hypothetical protein
MDERFPEPEERMPDEPTGDPERARREQESREEPETKYHRLRAEEESDRDALADDVAAERLTPRDD